MHFKLLFSRIAAPVLLSVIISFCPAIASASDEAPADTAPEWVELTAGSLTIYYQPGADLERIEKSLRKRATYFSSEIPSEDAPAEEKIRYQFAALFRRAEDILGMWPKNMSLKIKIFRTPHSLDEEYVKIFGAAEPGSEKLKSFYVDKYGTIYTSEEDISDSIMAHEMAHAIVDHYFAVIPPEKIRELLASYVDLHLAD